MITANMHYIKAVNAEQSGSTAWLNLVAADSSQIAIHMPMSVAVAMADAYAAGCSQSRDGGKPVDRAGTCITITNI